MATVPTKASPAPLSAESLEEKFLRLADAWHGAVAHHSSSSIRYGHPLYCEIIAMGPDVVPLLLRDLEVNRRYWFAALAKITTADPVPESAAGNFEQKRRAWLQWGRRTAINGKPDREPFPQSSRRRLSNHEPA